MANGRLVDQRALRMEFRALGHGRPRPAPCASTHSVPPHSWSSRPYPRIRCPTETGHAKVTQAERPDLGVWQSQKAVSRGTPARLRRTLSALRQSPIQRISNQWIELRRRPSDESGLPLSSFGCPPDHRQSSAIRRHFRLPHPEVQVRTMSSARSWRDCRDGDGDGGDRQQRQLRLMKERKSLQEIQKPIPIAEESGGAYLSAAKAIATGYAVTQIRRYER